MTEGAVDGMHQQCNGREFEQSLGDGGGEGSPACCSSWDDRVGHNLATEQEVKFLLSI